MNKYQNGKIYKIVDVGYNKCYIGSTCESLSQRMARQRVCYKSFMKGASGRTRSFDLFQEFGIDNCKIELVENYPCSSKEELLQREGHHIQKHECLNRCLVGRTRIEYARLYREENPDKVKESKKEWYERNKDREKQRVKTWREENKEWISEKAKERRIMNMDAYNERKREYYQANKEKINERTRVWASQQITCECGINCRKDWISKHKKSKAHIIWMKQQKEVTEPDK